MNVFQDLDACYKYFNRHLSAMFQKEGYSEITFNSYQYIIAIYKLHNEGDLATITEIANRLGIKKSSVAQMINTLLKGEYLKKKESSVDKRSFTLELSEKGYKMMKLEAVFSENFLKHFYYPLDEEEIKTFEETMGKIATNLLKGVV
ncbi:MarR family winged helix-turn-helix transcriptional regulator [Bacillus spongiae]|uniref:MarR family winged helix-turn-helix transcriptional regulator n=1 Tax=Bacillus spongiae TaxID=2683610 RepID=A0ABU8HJW8_9BACI